MSYTPKTRVTSDKIRKDETFILESIPLSDDDIFIEITPSTPLTHIASEYYDDPSMWRIIAKVNNISGVFCKNAKTVRIPTNVKIKFVKD